MKNTPQFTRFRTQAVAFFGCLVCLSGLLLAQASRPVVRKPVAVTSVARTNVEFNRDVRPILSDKCFKCHGPATQMRGLRLDLEEIAKRPLQDGRTAIVPGKPSDSEIIRRISSEDPKVRMPRSQTGTGDPLSPKDVETIRHWIEQGATWQKFWAFVPPTRSAVPQTKNHLWVRNPIDAFVLDRLERKGLRPSAQADRATLLRRVTLDLTGVPPTPVEIDSFLADRSPDAYEKVVNRLLDSPRYGERMAFPWLEAARYADSNGYQVDGERFMWRWRDWVIDSFNRNMRYDQFVVQQLAGDLLPNATLAQRIATGFNRNVRGNAEGGVIPEEYAVETVVDRVDTTGTVFLGLTVGCSRCHNHKFDPITQKDYYQLFAYFNNVPEHGTARRFGNSPPFIAAPTEGQQWQLRQFDEQLAAAREAFAKLQPDLDRSQREWEQSLDHSKNIAWGPSRGLVAHYAFDGDLNPEISISLDGKPSRLSLQDGEPTFVPGRLGLAAAFDGKRFVRGSDLVGFSDHMLVADPQYPGDDRRTASYDDPYTLAAWIYPTSPTGAIITKARDAAPPEDAGHALILKDGKIQYQNVEDLNNAIRIETLHAIPLNEWHHVSVTYDGTRWASGVKIYVDGTLWPVKALVDDLNAENTARREPIQIGSGVGLAKRFEGNIDDVRIYSRALSPGEIVVLADSTPINEIAARRDRTRAQSDKLRDYYLTNGAPVPIRDAWTKVLDAQARRDEFYASLPTVMVMEEMAAPRESHILIRGAYDRPGDKVVPSLPSILAPSPDKHFAPNRLGLAQWLVDPSNPLTARVTVNRFWQQYFGTGIVKTPADFGSQGDSPSHPELLDWLATEFIGSGWDVKALQKLIVTSATYQQDSKVSQALFEKDPENRLLARGPNVRLSAEMIRDQALAISGLLVEHVGGPSVKPYQPEGLWTELTANTGNNYVQDHGDALYRRSLYTFWKRTVPPPSMANFDASSRESCVVKITPTDTPLQALDLMNDVTYLEAARVFAQRTMKEGGATPRERIAFAYRLATAHRPSTGAMTILLSAFNRELGTFKADREAALKYVTHGESPLDASLDVSELAAYTTVNSMILNLDQTIVKD